MRQRDIDVMLASGGKVVVVADFPPLIKFLKKASLPLPLAGSEDISRKSFQNVRHIPKVIDGLAIA